MIDHNYQVPNPVCTNSFPTSNRPGSDKVHGNDETDTVQTRTKRMMTFRPLRTATLTTLYPTISSAISSIYMVLVPGPLLPPKPTVMVANEAPATKVEEARTHWFAGAPV